MENGALVVMRKGVALAITSKSAWRVFHAESGVGAPSVGPSCDEVEANGWSHAPSDFSERRWKGEFGKEFPNSWLEGVAAMYFWID